MNVFRRFLELWRGHPILVARAILHRLPGQPLRLEGFRRYERTGAPAAAGGAPGVAVRRAAPDDLEDLVACGGKRDVFRRRLAGEDTCLVASIDGRIVGYEWFSTKPEQVEERYGYVIPIPGDALYAYDAFVAEAARGHGVWTRIMAATDPLMKRAGRRRLIAHIDLGNRESVAAHARLGFRAVRSYLYLRVLGRSFLRACELPAAGKGA